MSQFNRNVNRRNHEISPLDDVALRSLSSPSYRVVRDQRFLLGRFSGTNLHPHPESVNTVPTNNPSVGVFPPESLGMNISSPNSLPQNIQRFSGRFFGSNPPLYHHRSGGNSITPSNDYSAAVLPNYEIHTAAGHVGNNHYGNQVQNMSSGLSLHPYGPQNQIGNSFSTLNSTEVQGQHGNGGTRRLPLKRRSPECAFTGFETGESSNMGMLQAGIPKRHAATPRNGHVVSNVQNLNQAGQSHSLQAAVNPQSFVRPPNMLSSMVYTRSDSHVQLPNQQTHPFPQYGNPTFFGTSQTQVSAIPFQYVPDFPFMMPRIALPVMEGSEARVPFHYNPRNIPANAMFGPQIGGGSWSHNQASFSFSNGNVNFHGGFPHPPHQYGAVLGMFQQPNGGEWFIRGLNVYQQHRLMLLGTVSPSIVFPQQSNIHSESSQENFPTGFGNNSISENQAGDNSERSRRVRLMWNEIRRAIERVQNGGALLLEELMLINDSIRSNLLEGQSDMTEQDIIDNLPLYESIFSLEARMVNMMMGLDEEEILLHIGREIFHSITEGSPQNTVACCICQEDYVNGEELGRVDCGHKFHIACIKQWLVRKNTCPICKQMALTIVDEEEEEEDDK